MKGDTGNLVLAAGQRLKVLTGPANYLYAYEASGLVRVELYRNNQLLESHTLTRLGLLPEKSYDWIELQNVSADENTVRLFYGPGKYNPPSDRSVVSVDDADPVRVSVADGEFFIDAVIAPPNDFEDLPDLTVSNTPVLLTAADSDKKYIYFEVPADADAAIRIGSNTITATRGYKVYPGQAVELYNSGALYAIRTGSVNVTVSRMLSNTVV